MGCPAKLTTQSTLDWLSFIVPTLSTVDASKVNRPFTKVNANYWCNGIPKAVHNGQAK
jgi:hypothetical protein